MEIMPTILPPSITGRCRTLFSVTMRMHSPTVCCGETEITGLLMISETAVSFEERPLRMILRA